MSHNDPLDRLANLPDAAEDPDAEFSERLLGSLLADLSASPSPQKVAGQVIELQEKSFDMETPTRRWLPRLLAVAAVALLVVGAIVVAQRSDDNQDQPANQPEITVANTTALASTPTDDEVSAEFTGDDCIYSGPTEFEVGDEFEITVSDVTEERMNVGFGVIPVPDGTTVAEVREKGIEEALGQDAEDSEDSAEFLFAEVTEQGTTRVLSTTLDVAGTWLVNCFVLGDLDGDFPATTFEVVEASASTPTDDELSAEFTGDDCIYSGPTEFEVGDEFEITVSDVTEERMNVGFGVIPVPDGTTVAEVREKGIEEALGQDAEDSEDSAEFLFAEVTEQGTTRVLSTTLDVAGTWLVNCFVLGDLDGDFPATTFEVVEAS